MTTIKYPLQAANGKLLLSDNANVEAITQVIQTKQGERVLRNTYGTDLNELDTIGDLSTVLGSLSRSIAAGTTEYLPLAIGLEGSVTDEGIVNVYVEYQDDQELNTLTVQL
jgi:hypothetical protein